MTAIGKKKKRVVVYRSKKEKSLMLPVILVGGVLVWYFMSKKPAAATVPISDTDTSETGQTQVIIPGGDVININPGGYNNTIPVHTTPSSPVVIATQTAVGKQYYTSLVSLITDPQWRAVFAKMTDNELYYAWWYVANYLSHNIPLLKSTKLLPTGQWDNSNPGNAELYNAVESIHSKYGIF